MNAPYKLDRSRIGYRSLSADHQQTLVGLLTCEAHADPARLIRARFRRLLLRLWNALTAGSSAILHLALHLTAAVVRWLRSRRAMTELAALSDRDLKDLGLYRSHIPWVASHGRHDPLACLPGNGRTRLRAATSPIHHSVDAAVSPHC